MVVCNSQPQCLAGHVCGWLYASERVSSFRPPLSQQRCRVHPQSQSFFFCSFQCHKKLSFADVLFLRSPSEIVIHPSKESDLLPAVLVHKSRLLYLHISSRDSQINKPLIVLILITTPLSLTSILLSTLFLFFCNRRKWTRSSRLGANHKFTFHLTHSTSFWRADFRSPLGSHSS